MTAAANEWQFYRGIFRDYMRRRIGAKWQYRELTEAEQEEFLKITAW